MAVGLRIGGCVIAAAITIGGIGWEVGRWTLHARKLAIETGVERLMVSTDPMARARFSRMAMESLERRSWYPLDVDLRLEAAAALRLVGSLAEAEKEYRAALRVSDRPEIHVALADVLAQTGRLSEALDHYTYAVRFSPRYLRFTGPYRSEVLARIEAWERRLRSPR